MASAISRIKIPIKEVNSSYYGPGWFYNKTSIVFFSNIADNSDVFKNIFLKYPPP